MRLGRFVILVVTCCAAARATEGRMRLSSGSFENGKAIPGAFTCDGKDALPALAWSGAPEGTKGFAVIVDDPDAPSGLFTHWMAWDLGAATTHLEGAAPAGAKQGTNDFGKVGWGGPCPPPGKPHHYRFHVYALGAPLGLRAGADRAAFDAALAGKVLDEGLLVGTYQRKR